MIVGVAVFAAGASALLLYICISIGVVLEWWRYLHEAGAVKLRKQLGDDE